MAGCRRIQAREEMPPSGKLFGEPPSAALILGIGLCLGLLLGMMLLDRSLQTPAAPHGIISLELAGSPATAQSILDSWSVSARIQAGISLGLDFFFLAAYAFTLSGICRKVAAHLPACYPCFKIAGGLLAGGAWLAGGLDGIENLALIGFLTGPGQAWQPVLAAGCAWPKFGLTALIFLYISLGGAVILVSKKR